MIGLLVSISVLLILSACDIQYILENIPGLGTIKGTGTLTVRGSGNIITEDRSVSNFNSISMSGSGEIIITQDDEESLTVEVDDNIMQYIITEVKGKTLHLGFDTSKFKSVSPSRQVKYNLKLKDLIGLTVSGSGKVESESIETDDLDIKISGSGDVKIDSLTAEKLDVDIKGSGDFNLAGEVNSQDINISGSGNYNAGDLQSETVKLNISGSGNATVWATELFDVRVSGSGNANYYGKPTVNSSISGSGKINSLGEK